ncbi:hypothetical protein KUCAC02_020314, partial [Chaenocephalus aceratus]
GAGGTMPRSEGKGATWVCKLAQAIRHGHLILGIQPLAGTASLRKALSWGLMGSGTVEERSSQLGVQEWGQSPT